MRLLDACLALVLTLALFASTVTVLLELLHRTLQQRVRDLRAMLGAVFDDALEEWLKGVEKDVAKLRDEFVAIVSTDAALDHVLQRNGGLLKHLPERLTAATEVTLADILRRLPNTRVYQHMQALRPEQLSQIVHRLEDGLDHFSQAATALFTARARLASFVVGVTLAAVVNVDAVRLFEHFVDDPELARQTTARLEIQLKSLPSVPPVDSKVDSTAEIRRLLDDLQTRQAATLPVGWTYFPYCLPPDSTSRVDPRCPAAADKSATASQARDVWQEVFSAIRHYGFWAICVFVTGLLIGLGGPYWFDIALSLGRFRDLLRKGSGTAPDTGATSALPDAQTNDAPQLISDFVAQTTQKAAP